MKLISLNIWHGKLFDEFVAFIERERDDTDLFCFQEVLSSSISRQTDDGRWNIFEEIALRLPEHRGMFFPVQEYYAEGGRRDEAVTFGQAIFARKHLGVSASGFTYTQGGRNTFVRGDYTTNGYGFAHIVAEHMGRKFLVVSMHGIPFPGDKQDTPERLRQSAMLRDFVLAKKLPTIVSGDFNLYPNTESIAMLSNTMHNLIAEFHITDTRGTMSHKKYPNNPQHFADFTFATRDITLEGFTVPDIPASDHLPLIARFTLP